MGDADDTSHREEAPEGEKPEGERRRVFERAIPDLLKRAVERAVETGVGKLTETPDNLRSFVGDMKLPKEVLNYLYHQIDDTKNGLYRVVAKEIRDVLEHTHFADELTKVLTKVSFEISTQIRFVPNETRPPQKTAEDDDDPEEPEGQAEAEAEARHGLPKPQVSAQVTVKDRGKETRRERKRREGT